MSSNQISAYTGSANEVPIVKPDSEFKPYDYSTADYSEFKPPQPPKLKKSSKHKVCCPYSVLTLCTPDYILSLCTLTIYSHSVLQVTLYSK